MNLTISYGSNSIDLNDPSDGIITTDYKSSPKDNNFLDTLELALTVTQQTALDSLRGLVDHAERRRRYPNLSQIWLNRVILSTQSQAEVLDIQIRLDPNFYDHLERSVPRVILQILRTPFVEDASPVGLVLNGDPEGIPSEDWVDTTNQDYLTIDGTAVTGVESSPIKLSLKNSSDETVTKLLVAVSRGNPLSEPRYEAEDATGGITEPETPDPTLYSGGYYSEVSVDSTPQVRLSWSSPATLDDLAGLPYYVIMRPAGTWGSDVQAKFVLAVSGQGDGGLVVAETLPILVDPTAELVELGILQIPNLPPGLGESASIFGYEFQLWLWGSEQDIGVDYIDLLGIDGGIRQIALDGYLFEEEVLVIDEFRRFYYVLTQEIGGTARVQGVLYGTPLTVKKSEDALVVVRSVGSGLHLSRLVSVKLSEYPLSKV